MSERDCDSGRVQPRLTSACPGARDAHRSIVREAERCWELRHELSLCSADLVEKTCGELAWNVLKTARDWPDLGCQVGECLCGSSLTFRWQPDDEDEATDDLEPPDDMIEPVCNAEVAWESPL